MIKFIALLIFSLNFSCLAQVNSSAQLFEEGINSYKQKNYEESKNKFQEALKVEPNSADILYNMGLSEYKLESLGAASAYWKKAIELSPFHFQARKSLQLIESKIPSSSRKTLWKSFRKNILSFFFLDLTFLLFTIFLIICATILIKHFSRRHIALKNHLPLPQFSSSAISITVCFIIFSALYFTKLYDHLNARGVVISEITPLFISPTEEDIKISELSQGTEIFITEQRSDWVQIKTQNGNYGWVKAIDIFQTTGAQIQ